MAQEKKERIFISYKRVDEERVFAIKDGIEQAIGEDCCTAIALEDLENCANLSTLLENCKVFILIYSHSYAFIDMTEHYWMKNTINFFAKCSDKHIVLITLDSLVLPEWLEKILPRQQVTDLSNDKSVQVMYKTLRKRLRQDSITKTKKFPEGVIKVGDLYYSATLDGSVVEVVPETGDKVPEDYRNFGEIEYLKGNATRVIYKPAIVVPKSIHYEGVEYNVIGIGEYAFYNSYGFQTVIIPDTITYIKKCAFADSNLQSILIPDSVVNIEASAFASCEYLTTVTLSKNLIDMGEYAFSGCKSLSAINLPSGLLRIGKGALGDCDSLVDVVIPRTVIHIGEKALSGNTTTLVVEEGNKRYDSRNNCNAIIETATNTIIAVCKNTIFPNGVKFISQDVHSDLLENIVIPDGVQKIHRHTFYNCSNLKSIIIPDSVLLIEDEAFAYCGRLSSVTLGHNIAKIGKFVFYNLSYYNDYNKECLPTIKVPKGLKDKYLSMLHEDFADRIIEL